MFTPAKEEATAEKKPNYVYHWHRIIGTVLLLSATLITAIYIFTPSANITQLPQIKTAPAPLQKVKDTQSTLPTMPIVEELTVKQATIAVQTDNKTNITDEQAVEEVANAKHTDTPTAKLAIEKTPLVIQTDKLTVEEVTSEITTENKSSDKNQQQPIFSQSRSTIFSEHIKTFVLTKAVIDRTPRGNLQEITFDHNNVATVYAFCLAIGLVDQSLFYTWQLNGKQVAQIEVGVGSDYWRSYSSKFIQPSMHGKWRVILGNKNGEILAINEFNY